ncbi:chitobiosyldiphosphodolichol beta-mannosyltransferase isoform X7 [Coregonus clupeaformis]|uniref:chitobiosyldiphosphodolichol beta-mannosyltransferase isoform X7 n=1 Tax=Coregonus clupeaformis TaxID=59861 RepID=UPI001E1C64B1|nr:chitobiosyldiphosphodolichol beta-mannosyltransferase isoform X7 [Coregonus clupeaformis]
MADACASTTLATVSLICFALLAGFYLTSLNALWTLVSVTVTLVLGSQLLWKLRRRDALTERRVCVLVLGDIGRSPRMQYHALSLSKHGYSVTFVGFPGTKPHQDVIGDERITIIPIAEVKGLQVGPRMVSYVTKVILQSLQLLLVLLKTDVQSHILMQNPPGLPGIVVTWLVCGLRGTRFIIDWHNYGYTIMGLSHGPDHPIVRLAQWYERLFGRFSSHNLCVTNAMKEDLQNNWNIKATTLYDKPPAIFKETPVDLQHQLFMRLAKTNPQFQVCGEPPGGETERTVFTGRDPSDLSVTLTSGRPALLISSTSWTEDEDFSILLKALEDYEGFVKAGASLPSLVCVITGNYSVDSVLLLVCVITGNYSVDSVLLLVCVITGNYSVDSVLLQVCVITGNYSVDSVLLQVCVITGNYSVDSVMLQVCVITGNYSVDSVMLQVCVITGNYSVDSVLLQVCVITGNYSVDSVLLQVCVITGNYSVDSVMLQVCVITGNYSVDSVLLLVCVITGNYSVDSVMLQVCVITGNYSVDSVMLQVCVITGNYSVDSVLLLVCVITGNYSVDSVMLQVCVITGNYSVDSVMLQVCVITGNYSVDSVLLLVCVITGNYSVDSVMLQVCVITGNYSVDSVLLLVCVITGNYSVDSVMLLVCVV